MEAIKLKKIARIYWALSVTLGLYYIKYMYLPVLAFSLSLDLEAFTINM